MVLHHPNGATSTKYGKFCGDVNEWERTLISIYTNLIDTTIHNQTRSNKSRTYGAREYYLKQDLVELASDVCCQLFLNAENPEHTLDDHVGIEVTQVVPFDVTQQDQEQRHAKRRKISLSFKSSLIDALKPDYTSQKSSERIGDEKIIPYLQIISRLLTKYPRHFEPPTVDVLFCTILDLIQDCRNILVKAILLEASENVLKVLTIQKRDLPVTDLLRLWEASVNTVSLNQCMKEGNSLIRYVRIVREFG